MTVLDEYPIHLKSFAFSKKKDYVKSPLEALTSFIDEAKTWDNHAQQNFACWAISLLLETSHDIHHILVHPLETDLLKPLLVAWMRE